MRPLTIVIMLVIGCGACEDEARVEGEHPYIRCALGEGGQGSFSVGGLEFEGEGSVVDVRGLTRWAAFAATERSAPHLGDLEPMPLMIIGGLGRDETSARQLLEAAGDRVVFVVPGGEDDADVLDLLDDEERWIDLRGVVELRLEHGSFIVLPGAPEGRYALGEGSCGYGDADLTRLADAIADEPSGHRWWLSWAAPRGDGPYSPDLGFAAMHVGDPHLTDLGNANSIRGGLFAWPATNAGVVSRDEGARPVADEAAPDLAAVVPRLGEVIDRGDESRLPSGVLLVEAETEGLHASFRPL